jgi:Tfp pilus assembly protein PilW
MLTNLDLIAIIIALLGCLTVIFLFWKQNMLQQQEIVRLRDELRKALRV